MDAQMIVDKCTSRLLQGYPFWGNLLLTFDVQPTNHLTQTMATDGVKLYFNVDYVEGQDEDILCTDLAHEGLHKAYMDPLRRGSRDPKLWNIATDYRINCDLNDSGFKLGDDYLFDPKFRGMDAEDIYAYLEQNPDDPANKQAQDKGGCGCGGLKDHPSKSQPDTGDKSEDEGDDGESDEPLGPEDTGDPTTGTDEAPTKGFSSVPDADFGEAEVLMQIAQAKNFAISQGNMPANIKAVIEELLNPKVRWEQVLQRFMETCAQDDFSWQAPDRRFLNSDMYLPSLQSEGVDTFVGCIDTSGSTTRFRQQFVSELSRVAQVLKFRTFYVMYIDTKVSRVDEYKPEDLPIKLNTYGGGGTSFVPPFTWLEERGITPKGMVYLTDTYGDFPYPPSYPVLWTVPAACKDAEVPFGEIVWIE